MLREGERVGRMVRVNGWGDSGMGWGDGESVGVDGETERMRE